jgi:hypothetical protein
MMGDDTYPFNMLQYMLTPTVSSAGVHLVRAPFYASTPGTAVFGSITQEKRV